MQRCIELARLGAGTVAPNPMVGAVLVHEGMIIGEGYHRLYGQAHAEVNCVASVLPEHRELISRSVMYVSLEPCAHYGKTPPCADMIVRERIPEVIIGCRDPFKEVDGKGIEKLEAGGVRVVTGVLEEACRELNKRFFTFHTRQRPYIILKWAQTADGRIGALRQAQGDRPPGDRLLISNDYSNRLVHKWRSEEAAILVGTNTALLDNPSLTTRLWEGRHPVRLVVDMGLRLPGTLKLFDGSVRTIVFNTLREEEKHNLVYHRMWRDKPLIDQINDALYTMNIQSVLVEGGARMLQSFFDAGAWDEARVITNDELLQPNGVPAPQPGDMQLDHSLTLYSDTIHFYKPSIH